MKSHKKLWLLIGILGCGLVGMLITQATSGQSRSGDKQPKQLRVLKTEREVNRKNQEAADTPKQKTLRDVGKERDVEVSVPNLEFNSEYNNLSSLAKQSDAILIGRITTEESSFSESGNFINTYYTVDVSRVLRDNTANLTLSPGNERPQPLVSPVRFVRSGGEVKVNGHRVVAKLKGSELLKAGKQYVLFLKWSPDFKSYLLMGGSSGAFLVQNDNHIKALGFELGQKKDGADLDTFIAEVLSGVTPQ
jgi:hypothetical protein